MVLMVLCGIIMSYTACSESCWLLLEKGTQCWLTSYYAASLGRIKHSHCVECLMLNSNSSCTKLGLVVVQSIHVLDIYTNTMQYV